jgi:hypothetical protein
MPIVSVWFLGLVDDYDASIVPAMSGSSCPTRFLSLLVDLHLYTASVNSIYSHLSSQLSIAY